MVDQMREVVDRHFKRLRGKLFTLTEASLPEPQQEAFKREIKVVTQAAWRGIILDAGLEENRIDASAPGLDKTVIKEG